jgi:fucose 4-O-acetylase-like acetyltransferase
VIRERSRANPGAAERGAAAAETAPQRARDPYWDNVRFVAIALVVVGHTIETLSRSDAMYALYLFVYAFHMPLFALASGAFARAEPITRAEGGKIITQLLVPYMLFSGIWALVRWGYSGESFVVDLASPYWHLWFLTALVAWRLALPVFAALRHPVLWAAAVAVASGYMPTVGWRFDASRTLGFLPFFVLGWSLRQRGGWDRLSALGARVGGKLAGLAGLALAAVVCVAGVDVARAHNVRAWVQLEKNYAGVGATTWAAGGARLALLLVAVALCACVLLVVPRWDGPLSRWGRASMYVYLLHLFPLYVLRESDAYADWFGSGPRQVGLVLAAVALTVALATTPVVAATRWLVEPRWAGRLLMARDLRS